MLCFFDVVQDGQVVRDEFGQDVGTCEDARAEAIGLVLEIMRDGIDFSDDHVVAVDVRREGQSPFYRVSLSLCGRSISERDEGLRPPAGRRRA